MGLLDTAYYPVNWVEEVISQQAMYPKAWEKAEVT